MNLLQIRREVVKISGRYDLVDARWGNNGIDFYINEGQKLLDRNYDYPKKLARHYQALTANQVYAKFENCLAIKEVWMSKSDARYQLTRKDIKDVRAFYDYPPTGNDSGTPLYFASAVLRVVPETDRMTAGELAILAAREGIQDVLSTASPMHYTYSGILWMPPVSEYDTLEVWGDFYSPELSSNSDQSYWSSVHPQTLIHAALYRLAMDNRNQEEMKDWLVAIQADGVEIEKAMVLEDSYDIDQIEG